MEKITGTSIEAEFIEPHENFYRDGEDEKRQERREQPEAAAPRSERQPQPEPDAAEQPQGPSDLPEVVEAMEFFGFTEVPSMEGLRKEYMKKYEGLHRDYREEINRHYEILRDYIVGSERARNSA